MMKKKRLVRFTNNPYHAFYGYGYPYLGADMLENQVYETNDVNLSQNDTYNNGNIDNGFVDGACDCGGFDGGE